MSSILFVSLDRDLRAVASRALSKAGWEVVTVAHGGHAVLECVAGRTFDVLVIDDPMSDDTGRRLGRQLRRYCPVIGVVCLRGQKARPASEGVTVVRPFTADDLIDAVLHAAAATALASA